MLFAIVGSGRSGTSLVARLLNICGMNIGDPAAMAPANEHNQKGYWEPASIIHINSRVLELFRGSFDQPPMFPPDWQDDPRLNPLYGEARQILNTMFSGNVAVCGFKDPRTTLTIPFWRKVVPDLKFVVCMRNPIDVAKSVSQWSISHRYGFVVWHLYNLCVFKYARPEERIITHYADYYADARSALNPVLKFAGLDEVAEGSEKHAAIMQFFDKGLHHHRSSVDDLNNALVPKSVRDLYLDILENGRQGVIESQVRSFDQLYPLLAQMTRMETENMEMRRRLNSTTHRFADKICTVLIALSKTDSVAGKILRKRSHARAVSAAVHDSAQFG